VADGSLFTRSAFRLELLDWYTSPGTERRLALWLAGKPDDAEIRAYWDQAVGDLRRAGKTIARVHVVAEPLTDYLRYEFNFYCGSVAAGEDIRILRADAAAGLDLPNFDYWLFDDQRAAVMYFGDRGAWLHSEIVTDPGFVASCRHWRDEALSKAISLSDYMAERSAA
jgi:hypothetical protein